MEEPKSCSFYFVSKFIKKYFIFLFFVVVVFITNGFFVSSVFAEEEINYSYPIEGYYIVSGKGTLFRINIDDDSILEVKTQIPINLRIDASDKMIIIENKPSETGIITSFTISNLHPLTTYYKYLDSYLNLEEITTDAIGSLTYQQDISNFHSVFIQTIKSTKFISPTATGGNCSSIGTWDNTAKTCTLTQDVSQTIQINGDGITLDGAGHTIQGYSVGFGVYVPGKNNVTIKNLIIKGFFWGINATQVSQSNFLNNILENNVRGGILFSSSQNITLQNNQLIDDDFYVTGNTVNDFIHSIDISNTIDGKPILYLVNAHDEEYHGMSVNAFYCIACANVLFEGSTFTANNALIFLYNTNSTVIKNVEMQNDTSRINLEYSTLNTIESNTARNINNQTIVLNFSTENKILHNTVSGSEPIALYQSSNNNLIEYNDITGASSGIYISGSNDNIIQFNKSYQSGSGITLYHGATGNDIHDNNFLENNNGFKLSSNSANDNLIYNNNFIDNLNVLENNGESQQIFYKDLPIGGNYWSDFDSPLEGCNDVNNDGICDTGRIINNVNKDLLPWVKENRWNGEIISEKEITSFNLKNLTPNVDGIIDEVNHTITLNVPFSTDITTIVPTISISSGASINPNNNISQNFSSPVIYTVTATDMSTQIYTVTVIVAKPTHNPVILIPGITGTYLIKDYGDKTEIWPDINRTVLPGKDTNLNPLYLEIDGKENIETPIIVGDIVRGITLPVISDIHVFDKLISELIDNGGYIEGEDLFVFPYDWRISTSKNAISLKEKIEEILLETGYENVDIIAHSMGGLIAKKYIADNGKDKMDQLIFVGTPQLGAPKAFKALMYGDNMGYGISISDTKKVSVLNASRVKYISQNMPSVYELLPSAKYIESNGSYVTDASREIIDLSSFDLNYLETQNLMIEKGRNNLMFPFAENLHDSIDNLDLSDIETHNFIGCGTKTIGGIIAKQKRSWKNLFLGFVDDIHLKYVNGDETVPLESANKAIGAKMYFAKGNTHGSLPSAEGVRQNILSILKGEDLESYANILDDASTCNVSGEVVSTHSPVELHIYDEEGNHTGPNADGDIEYGIEGVQYDIVEGENYVFLPSGVNYRIVTNATDTGGYNFDIESLDEEDNITDTYEWTLIPLETLNSSGEIWIGPDYPESDYSVNMDEDGDGIIDENYEFSYNGTTEAEIATAPSRKFSSGSVPRISLIPVTAIQNLEIKTPVLEPVQEKKELAVNIITITDIDKGKNINKEKVEDSQIKQDIIKDDNIRQNNLSASVGNSGVEIGLLWPAIILFGFIGISLAKMFIKL